MLKLYWQLASSTYFWARYWTIKRSNFIIPILLWEGYYSLLFELLNKILKMGREIASINKTVTSTSDMISGVKLSYKIYISVKSKVFCKSPLNSNCTHCYTLHIKFEMYIHYWSGLALKTISATHRFVVRVCVCECVYVCVWVWGFVCGKYIQLLWELSQLPWGQSLFLRSEGTMDNTRTCKPLTGFHLHLNRNNGLIKIQFKFCQK